MPGRLADCARLGPYKQRIRGGDREPGGSLFSMNTLTGMPFPFGTRLPAKRVIVLLLLACCVITAAVPSASADDHGSAETIDNRVSEDGQSGVNAFIVNLYNDHRVLYAVFVIVCMVVVGVSVAQFTEFLLRVVGLKRK